MLRMLLLRFFYCNKKLNSLQEQQDGCEEQGNKLNKILSLLPERINSIKIDLNRLSNKAQLSETLAKNPNLLSLSIVNFPLPLNASMNEINSKAQWDQGVFPAHIFLANSV